MLWWPPPSGLDLADTVATWLAAPERDMHGGTFADFDNDGNIDEDEIREWMRGKVIGRLSDLSTANQLIVIRTFAMTCALDGRIRSGHRRTLRQMKKMIKVDSHQKYLKNSLRFVRNGE